MKTEFFSQFTSVKALIARFKTETECRNFLAEERWHGSPVCPYCGCKKVYRKKDGRHICKECKRTFSVLVGTVFQNTKLPLLSWFIAIHLLCNGKKGVSSCQLAREIGVTQKTAWFMLQKIRMLLKNEDDGFPDKECGEVKEIGVDRHGNPLLMRLADRPYRLHPRVRVYVREESRIYTDEYICIHTLLESELEKYQTEELMVPYMQKNVGERVVDGFWLQLKRMVSGVYHYVSASLFHRYLYEAMFRHETCRCEGGRRFAKVLKRIGKVVPYKTVRPVKVAV